MLRKVLLTTTALLAFSVLPAKANIVLFGASDVLSFRDVGAQGFGDFHRALTLQDNGIETGGRGFNNVQIDQAINGANKANTPTLGQLGWDNGLSVGIGFNTDQHGQADGITMQSLRLTIWDLQGNAVFTADLANAPINFSGQALAMQQGNGNAVFDFELDANERQEFNDMLASHPGNTLFTAGLRSTLGCGAGAPATCMASDDGPDSFVLFDQTIAAVPEASTWAMMLLGFAGIGTMAMRKRRGDRSLRLA